jgi:DNA-binding NtrC family response regulator
MARVVEQIQRLQGNDLNVLVTGESGTGKELVARAIHNLGNRAQHPFVAVPCGAIPETLIEAELFGHEKGAFTGSTGARAGYLEQAGEGTLFLDEIGELSLSTQVKLLRVLQQREYSRLGSSKLLPMKGRVLFATHRNLADMVEEGLFRRDLYFRVNIIGIHVPALRDRTEDIPALAHHCLKRYAAEYGKPVHDILPNAMEALVEYDWPGNVRELENAIQKAVVMAETATALPGPTCRKICGTWRKWSLTRSQPTASRIYCANTEWTSPTGRFWNAMATRRSRRSSYRYPGPISTGWSVWAPTTSAPA